MFVAHAGENNEQGQLANPSRNRCRGEPAQAPHFAIAGLTGDVDLEEAFGAPTVCFTLLALQLEPPSVAIERLLQRGDDDAGDAGFGGGSRGASGFSICFADAAPRSAPQ